MTFAAASVRCDFAFDAAGTRARQTKERTAPNDSRTIEEWSGATWTGEKRRASLECERGEHQTPYLGAYEREHGRRLVARVDKRASVCPAGVRAGVASPNQIHSTRASGTAPQVTTRTLHRHSLPGGAFYTRKVDASGTETRLAAVIKDHLGSTDVILTAAWDTT